MSLFTVLLARQFPIEPPGHALRLRTARNYVRYLSVHINHLNQAVREQTAKSTTLHIAEHGISEATALLQYAS